MNTQHFKHTIAPVVFLFLFLVFSIVLVMYISQRPPTPLPESTPPAEFSAERASRHVKAIAIEPRPIGTPAHARARIYIINELRALGLDPHIQNATVVDPISAVNPAWAVAGNIQNVVARMAGTGGSKAILLVCHYDSVATGPGASDDGAGVATLLETARALRAGPALKNDVILLFTDAEEVGLLGAKGFVKQHPWINNVGLAMNFDTGGDKGVVYTYETSPGNAGLIAEYAKAVPYPVASSMMYEVYRMMPNESDFTPLRKAGIAGFNFAHIGGKYRYHTITDNPDNLDQRSLQHHGSYALSLTRHFGNIDLMKIKRDSNYVYFNILNLGFLYYPEEWAFPLAILTALFFIGLLMFGWRCKKVSLPGLLVGALAFLLNMFVSTGAVWLLWQGLLILYPLYGAVIDIHNGFWYWLAFIILTFAITTALYNLFRRRLRLADLTLGALLCWLIPTVVLAYMMPGISYWFEWPLLFSMIGLGLLWVFPGEEYISWCHITLLAAVALPAFILFAWCIYSFYLALGTNLIIIPVIIMALFLGLFIPHLDLFARPYPWSLPATAGLVAIAALIAGSLNAVPDKTNPQPDSILYALNADTRQALWISEDAKPDVWTSQFLGKGYRQGKLPEIFPHLADTFLSSPAPVINLPAAQSDVLNDCTAAGIRVLSLHITIPRQVPWVEVSIRSTSPISAITLAGSRISYDNSYGRLGQNRYMQTFQYWIPPEHGFDVAVAVRSPGNVKMFVREYEFGLPRIPDFTYNPRPDYFMPSARHYLPENRTDTVLVTKSFIFNDNK